MDNLPNWENWLKNLELKLHPDAFKQYFGEIRPIGLDQDVLRVEVPVDSDFAVMNQYYTGLSSLAWKEVSGNLVRVEFLPASPFSRANTSDSSHGQVPARVTAVVADQQFSELSPGTEVGLSSAQAAYPDSSSSKVSFPQSNQTEKANAASPHSPHTAGSFPRNNTAAPHAHASAHAHLRQSIAQEPKSDRRIQRSFSDLPGIYLNDEYTFDTFVVGSNTEFAHAAAMSVAQNVDTNRYNPLLIYGGSGLGKTHLVQAIGHYYLKNFPQKTVHYIDANSFKREYVSSLMKKNENSQNGKSILDEMSDYYRNKVDLLLMDDIQDLSNQTETQNAFFHIFNSLHQSGKQIVLTSDCPPSEVEMLEDRLISRFEWGLTVDVQTPSIETREAILKDKALRHKIEVSDEIITFIATSIDRDVRSLEQVIKQLMFKSTHLRSEIDLELCKEVLANVNKGNIKKIKLEDVLKMVSDYFEIDQSQILSSSRGTKEVAQARQVAMFLYKEASKNSLKSIGQAFSNRDHATVIYAIRKIQETMDVDPIFAKSIESLKHKLLS